MVEIEELYITNTGNDLFIKAKVKDLEYYKNVYISDVYILNQDQYDEAIIPDEVISDPKKYTYHEHFDNTKEIEGSVSASEINTKGNFSSGLYFVYVRCTGMPAFNTPCGMDNEYTIGVITNWEAIYCDMSHTIKDLEAATCNSCHVPEKFIDNLLMVKALECEINAGNYMQAKIWYNDFFKKKNLGKVSTCNCNG